MANGTTPLGERLRGWLEAVYEAIGLKYLIDRFKTRHEEWDAIQSISDLRVWVRKWGGANPWEITEKALALGASPDDVRDILDPGFADLRADPSVWLGNKMNDAFASPLWQEVNQVFGALVFDPWLASMVGGQLDPGSPEIERVRQFLGTQMGFEALGSVISLMVESATAGQVENAGKVFSDAKWSLGTCFTSWQSTSPIVEATILRPLQRLINERFREADFTRAQWMDLFALGKVTGDRLARELARQGYADDKIQWLLDLAERQPSRGDLVQFYKKNLISDVTLALELGKLGYPTKWIDLYMRLYADDEVNEEKGAYLGTLRRAFKEQLISESEFRQQLEAQSRSDYAVDLEVAVLKLGWEVEEKEAAKADIKAAFMADSIGGAEARNWLGRAGFSTHTIDLLLSTWEKQRAPTYKTLNKGEILKAWGAGVLTQPEAYQRLLDVGYSPEGATALMETHARTKMQTKEPAPRELSDSHLLAAWQAGLLSKEETIDRLVGLEYDREDAELRFETYAFLHPQTITALPKELAKEDILSAWGRGVLTEETTADKLVEVGYSEDDATLLMQSYLLRAEALPPSPSISELIAATRRGIITPGVLSQKLAGFGLAEPDVAFYVTYAITPLPERTRSLSRSDITTLWVKGRHDRAWAIERLLAMNYSPEDVDDILWLNSPTIEDTETYVLWRMGLVDDIVATAMWLSMGFTEDEIDEVIGTGGA